MPGGRGVLRLAAAAAGHLDHGRGELSTAAQPQREANDDNHGLGMERTAAAMTAMRCPPARRAACPQSARGACLPHSCMPATAVVVVAAAAATRKGGAAAGDCRRNEGSDDNRMDINWCEHVTRTAAGREGRGRSSSLLSLPASGRSECAPRREAMRT